MTNMIHLLILMLVINLSLVPLDCSATKCVILMHGLARSHHCLDKLADKLRKENYVVVNRDYPSTRKSIKTLAEEDLASMVASCSTYHPDEINFVTHSMGGIILQYYLQHHTIPHLHNIVMLSPPNHGSEVADLLKNLWLYKWMAGPAGQELTTEATSVPNQLKLTGDYHIGVITGSYSLVPFSYYIFGDGNDSAVSIKSSQTKCMKDFITISSSHPFIMKNDHAHREIIYFLKHGKFEHAASNLTTCFPLQKRCLN